MEHPDLTGSVTAFRETLLALMERIAPAGQGDVVIMVLMALVLACFVAILAMQGRPCPWRAKPPGKSGGTRG
jgi:hypothetical protein